MLKRAKQFVSILLIFVLIISNFNVLTAFADTNINEELSTQDSSYEESSESEYSESSSPDQNSDSQESSTSDESTTVPDEQTEESFTIEESSQATESSVTDSSVNNESSNSAFSTIESSALNSEETSSEVSEAVDSTISENSTTPSQDQNSSVPEETTNANNSSQAVSEPTESSQTTIEQDSTAQAAEPAPFEQELKAELKDKQENVFFTAKVKSLLPQGAALSVKQEKSEKQDTVLAFSLNLTKANSTAITEGSFQLTFESKLFENSAKKLEVWTVEKEGQHKETKIETAAFKDNKFTLTVSSLNVRFEVRPEEEHQQDEQADAAAQNPIDGQPAADTQNSQPTSEAQTSQLAAESENAQGATENQFSQSETAENSTPEASAAETAPALAQQRVIAPEDRALTEDPANEYLPENAIWANGDLYLTGKMPQNAIVEATPVTVEIDGEYVIGAYDIKIYANENQKAKGETWQPASSEVTVHFFAESADQVHVYHTPDGSTTPELVDTVDVEDGWAEFDASHFSTYTFSFFEDLYNHAVNAVRNTLYPNTVYENDEIILTGNLPRNAVIEAEKVDVQIEGRQTLVAYDITIYQNSFFKALGIAWQPKEGTVKVEIKSDAFNGIQHGLTVYHLDDASAKAEMVQEDVAIENGSVSFDADSFSVYALTDEYLRTYHFITYNNSTDMQYVEYQIFTDLGTTTYTQTIKNGESLVIPQLPALQGSDTSTFTGWFVASGVTLANGVYTYTTLSDTPFDFENIPEITHTETVYLFAKFADYAYVIFHDQYNGSIQGFPVASTRRGEKINGEPATATATIRIDDFAVSYDDNSDENTAPSMSFHGWSYTPITEPGAAVDDKGNPVSRIDTDTIDIRENTHLYPIFSSIYWLNYNSGPTGSGATYIPSAYYYADEGRVDDTLPKPVRSGYEFDGWYTGSVTTTDNGDGTTTETVTYREKIGNADGTLVVGASDTGISVSTGKILLTQNTTIYAKWSESAVHYAIVIWRQKATDAPNLPDAEKTYDYAQSISLSGTTGQMVSVANVYKQYGGLGDYVGFTFDRCDSSKTIASDGSTVLNVYYDRNVHTLTFRANNSTTQNSNSNSPIVHTVTALYGADISNVWSFVGSNRISYPLTNRNTSWYPYNSSTYTDRLTKILTMPDEDIGFYHVITNYTNRFFHYYVEALPGATNTRTFNGKQYTLYADLTNDFNRLYKSLDFWSLTGFVKDRIATANGTDVTNQIGENTEWSNSWNNNLYFYYNRESYKVAFYDSYTSEYVYVNGSQLEEQDALYDDYIKNYLPADPTPVQIIDDDILQREGYEFTGWYTDAACTTRAFFEDNEEYRNYTGNKALYEKMPAYNLRFYAGWDTIWYLIEIDPNYGTMNSGASDSTWFWEPYNGEPIEEYTWVRRDYEESVTGTYYYVKHDRAYYGYGDEYVNGENQERHTYYTTNPGEATDLTTYKYASNAYRYAGWYEVHEDGTETLYHFGEPVTHNIKLILHWKKIGTYYVRYNAVVEQDGKLINGVIDNGDANDQLFVELDEADYADNADVVISRSVKAPESYNFIGWKIRGDESGKIYYPGQSFEFHSTYAVTITEQGNPHETIFLDAVYSYVETAKIVYDANGGTINPDTVDYGKPAGESMVVPNTICDTEAGTATISNLVNNSSVILSNGTGFTREGAVLTGWNTEPDASGTHYELGSSDYYVDNKEPIKLYAEWQVKIYFHLNKPSTDANFGGTWDSNIYTKESDTIYSRMAYIGAPIEKPALDPEYIGEENLFFHYWGTQRYGDDTAIEEYDFTQPINGELHLYAYWAGPIEVPVHAVDSSGETLADKDSEWLIQPETVIEVGADPISLATEEQATLYASKVPNGYEYAFAAVHSSTAGIQSISEDEAITELFYNSSEKKVYVRYTDGSTAPLADEDEVYLVFYQQKELPIGYKLAEMGGTLTTKNVSGSAPGGTGALGSYSMSSNVTAPLGWASYNTNSSNYYAYAIGPQGATTTEQLQIITSSSNQDINRPNLQIRNTWRGFEYSLTGSEWIHCGYENLQLYVIYFESHPTIITLTEKTIGTELDMGEEFEYTITIETTTITTTSQERRLRWDWYWSDYGDPYSSSDTDRDTQAITLSDGLQKSETLFYTYSSSTSEYESGIYLYRTTTTTTVTQTITITQTAKTGFFTDHDATGSSHVSKYVYTYTTSADSTDQSVTYTNTHTPLSLDVHVALVDANGIILDDDERASSGYTISMALGDEKTFLTEISPETLFKGDNSLYSFAGVIYGTSGKDQGNAVTVLDSDVSKIGYKQLTPPDGNIYELCLDGDTASRLGDGKIYYLFYPMPKLVYVKETAGGTLQRITGAEGGAVTYNGEVIQLNGVNVEQDQKLHVSDSAFLISQTVGSGNFNMPPHLDDGDEKLFLNYVKLGAGPEDATQIENLDGWTDTKAMQLKVIDNQVKWSLDGETWNTFSGAPTIYAIYHEIGYDLTIKKTVENGNGSQTFGLTISSFAITETSYAVTGTGTATVAAIPATSTEPGTIHLTVRHGSEITISGLGKGEYTLIETGECFELINVSVTKEGTAEPEKPGITDNSIIFNLDKNSTAELTNKLVTPAPTGLHTDLTPYLWMVLTGGLMALLGILIRLRRRKEEEL